jgi:hypothetical protein
MGAQPNHILGGYTASPYHRRVSTRTHGNVDLNRTGFDAGDAYDNALAESTIGHGDDPLVIVGTST